MAGTNAKAPAKRKRGSLPVGVVSTPGSNKRRRKGKKRDQARKIRTPEGENTRAENQITKLLNEAIEAVTRSAEAGDDLDSDLEILKDAVKEAEKADKEESSDSDVASDAFCSSDSKPTIKKFGNRAPGRGLVVDAETKNKTRKSTEEKTVRETSVNNSSGSGESNDSEIASSTAKLAEKKSETVHLSGASDSDDGGGNANHRADLEDLQKTDPEFYKYLKENDAELLDFDSGSGSEDDSDVENARESDEARAAAEAGLDWKIKPESEGEGNEEIKQSKQKKNSKFVDLRYLRELQAQLALRRTSLKACRDLLRIFRAGRELAVSTHIVNKSKKNALKAKKQRSRKKEKQGGDVDMLGEDDDSDDEFVDDDSFTAGEIRFASSKAYQKAMNMAIIGIQGTLDLLLAKPQVKSEPDIPGISPLATWTPREHKRWVNLEPTFKAFVFHLTALTEHMKDARTLRFLLKRLTYLVPYTREQPSLTRKLTRIALSCWAAQSRDVSHATKLRAYLLLHAIAAEDCNVEIVLRKVCQSFMKTVATVCNPRTLPSIIFALKCIVELFGMNMGASYTVAFTHLRQMAVTLRTVLTSKNVNADIEKIHNWTVINSVRLWASVLMRYGSEDELGPLIYPFVQVSLGILRLQSGPRTYPLRLQVCSFLTDLVVETGVFIPVPPHLLAILRCAELKKVPKRGATRALEWRSILRVADDVVGTKPYLGGIIQGVVFQLAKYFAGISKHVSFPEISHAVVTELRKFSKELRVPDWRRDIGDLCEQLQKTAKLVTDMRSKADFGPKGALGPRGMLEIVPGLTAEMKTPIQRMYEIERKRKEREEAIRDETSAKAGKQESSTTVADEHVEDEDESGAEQSGTDEEVGSVVAKNPKFVGQKSSMIALVGEDEEPDEVAEFQLSDSE